MPNDASPGVTDAPPDYDKIHEDAYQAALATPAAWVMKGVERARQAQEKVDAKLAELPDDADHYKLADACIRATVERTGERPVYSMGTLWRVQNNI